MNYKQDAFSQYADYYNLFYADKDYKSEADYVNQIIKQNNSQCKSLIELGCGTGKHAHHFLTRGYSVHGIDLSEQMISIAKLDAVEGLTLEQGDVRTYRNDEKFDAAISLFHVASYQTTNKDIAQFLETARFHLKQGGIFVFDFWYGPAVLTDKPAVRAKTIENDKLKITRIAKPDLFAGKNVCNVNYEIIILNKDTKKVRELNEVHSMRYYFKPELDLLLEQSSFEIIRFTEWMKETEPGFDSWYAVMVAKAI